jgi:2'-5' RNA ligase
MKRLFAALKINPDPEFLSAYRSLQSAMKNQQIKWVEERNIHITLKFFGETEERTIPRISSIINKRASQTSPIELKLSKLGIFGSSYSPKVIWAGIEPYEQLATLMKNIQQDLKPAGFEPDRQNLVPHLTLGRVKMIKDKILFERAIGQFKNISSASMTIGDIILYESILHREGPEYVALEKFRFI